MLMLLNKDLASLSVSFPAWFMLNSKEGNIRAPDKKSQRLGFKALAM